MKKTLVSAFASLALVLCLGGCAAPSGPTATVERFTQAASDLNVEQMLECCDATTNATMELAFGFADGLMGSMGVDLGVGSMDLIKALAPSLYDINSAMSGEVTSMSVRARDLQETIQDDTHATVTGVWEIEAVSGENVNTQSGDVTFNLIKEDGEWKIDFSNEIASAFSSMM